MARGDSYQLQGQQGGVYLEYVATTLTATGSFRNIVALTQTTISAMTSNFVTSTGAAVTSLVIPAGTSVGGQFKDISITGGKVICYYA